MLRIAAIGTGRRPATLTPTALPKVPLVYADDQAIVLALIAREVGAMELVYDQWSGLLYTIARSISSNGPAAERLVMDACLELWRRPELALQHHKSLRNYLCTLVLSAARAGLPSR